MRVDVMEVVMGVAAGSERSEGGRHRVEAAESSSWSGNATQAARDGIRPTSDRATIESCS